jgi:hypothetical protein
VSSNLITSLWLNEVGFKPHTFGNEPNQHWLLWLSETTGLELSFGRDKPRPWWFCWLRARGLHTPEKLINLRDLNSKHEVITLVQAVTGRRWNPARHYNGSVWIPKAARKVRFL